MYIYIQRTLLLQAKAEAISRAEAARIEAEAAVAEAKLKAEALKIETDAELERMKAAREADIKFTLEQNKMELDKAQVYRERDVWIR